MLTKRPCLETSLARTPTMPDSWLRVSRGFSRQRDIPPSHERWTKCGARGRGLGERGHSREGSSSPRGQGARRRAAGGHVGEAVRALTMVIGCFASGVGLALGGRLEMQQARTLAELGERRLLIGRPIDDVRGEHLQQTRKSNGRRATERFEKKFFDSLRNFTCRASLNFPKRPTGN